MPVVSVFSNLFWLLTQLTMSQNSSLNSELPLLEFPHFSFLLLPLLGTQDSHDLSLGPYFVP